MHGALKEAHWDEIDQWRESVKRRNELLSELCVMVETETVNETKLKFIVERARNLKLS
jgi:uncharacterized protein YwgA